MPAPKSNLHPENMRTPIRILTRTSASTSSGGSTPTYADAFGAPVWSKDSARKVNAIIEGGKLITTVYHTYTVRYNASIRAGMYIQDPGYANLLYIQGVVDPQNMRQWLELTATDIEG